MDSLLALFPLELVLLPWESLPLHVFEPRYKEMVGECLSEKRPFGVVRSTDNKVSEIGCTAEIIELQKRYDDGRMDILTAGRRRFEIVSLDQQRSFLRAEVTYIDDEAEEAPAAEIARALDLHTQIVRLVGPNAAYEPPSAAEPQLSYRLAASLPIDIDFKQILLGMRAEPDRIAALVEFYREVLPKLDRARMNREKAGGNGHIH